MIEVLHGSDGGIDAIDIALLHVIIVVEVDGDSAPGIHQHILSLMQQLITLGVVSGLAGLGIQSVISGPVRLVGVVLAQLSIVVAGIGDEQGQHGGGIVEVTDPALTSEVELALLTGVKEDIPLLLVNGQLDTDLLRRTLSERFGGDWTVLVTHSDGTQALYAYLAEVGLAPGDQVERGKSIGVTGTGENAHLYFEYRVDMEPSNPKTVLSEANP